MVIERFEEHHFATPWAPLSVTLSTTQRHIILQKVVCEFEQEYE